MPPQKFAFQQDRGLVCLGIADVRKDHLPCNKRIRLIDGDYDIFGDGSLAALHTRGTRRATNLYSFVFLRPDPGLPAEMSRTSKPVSITAMSLSNNWNNKASLQSMDKIAAILAKEHAQLWINHDQAQSDAEEEGACVLRVIGLLVARRVSAQILTDERPERDLCLARGT